MIKSLSGKDGVENVKKDIDEIETINIELEHSMAKLLSENENLIKEREHLKSIYKNQFDSIRKTRVESKEHLLKNELRNLKGKNVVDTAVLKPSATIALEMFKLDIEPISHRLKNNRDAHEVYIEKTIENTVTLRGFEERARIQNPSEPLLESACMFTKHVQELFAEPVTSSSNVPKQIDSLKTKDSNKPLLTSTGVKPTTSASGSKPSGNTKNNRITRPPSSNKKNKVEDHSRKVKSSLNKMNSVSEHNSNALVKHSVRNAKFEYICAICNKCLFDANHDMCIIDYMNDVNVRSKFKSKRNTMRKVWKPMGKVFSEIGYSWKHTGCPDRPLGSGPLVPKHMTGNRSHLMNFVSKFLGTVRFGNDQVAKIIGYVPVAAAPRAVEIVDLPMSTSIDQDAPSSSIPSKQDQEHSLIISQGSSKRKESNSRIILRLNIEIEASRTSGQMPPTGIDDPSKWTVKTAFLKCEIKEEVLVSQQTGFVDQNNSIACTHYGCKRINWMQSYRTPVMATLTGGGHGLDPLMYLTSSRPDLIHAVCLCARAFDLRNFDLEVMEFESEHSNTTAKLPILKLESLDSIFNRLQKIVSRLAILGVVISQEDLNSKFLSSLPPEWNTHVVVWMNKPSIDDLYNNFKIVEQKVKKYVGASSGAQNLAFMIAPSTSSTNHVNTAMPAYEVSTTSPDV
ncbi:hypothetical protein Tco_1150942, partial [Tanacetum coccineum]